MANKNNIEIIQIYEDDYKKAQSVYKKMIRFSSMDRNRPLKMKDVIYVDGFDTTLRYTRFFNINGSTVELIYDNMNQSELEIRIVSDNRNLRKKAKRTLAKIAGCEFNKK